MGGMRGPLHRQGAGSGRRGVLDRQRGRRDAGLRGASSTETTNGGIRPRHRRADRGVDDQRRRRRRGHTDARAGVKLGVHQRRHQAPAALGCQGDHLGKHHQRRHQRRRAAIETSRNPRRRRLEARLNGGGPADQPRRHQRRHPHRQPLRRSDVCLPVSFSGGAGAAASRARRLPLPSADRPPVTTFRARCARVSSIEPSRYGIEHRRDGCSTSGTPPSCSRAASPPSRSPRTMFRFAWASDVERLELAQQLRGEHGAGPRAEVFRRQILAGDLFQVGVDVLRPDRLPLAVLVDVLKQIVAGKIAALLHDAREAAIVQIDLVLDAALAAERERNAWPLHVDVPIAQRRQAVATGSTARTRRCRPGSAFSRAAARRWRAPSRAAARPAQVIGRRAADLGSACAKPIRRSYLVSSRICAPLRVIAILLATARIAAGGLQVAARVQADPDVRPRRRNHQRLDALRAPRRRAARRPSGST